MKLRFATWNIGSAFTQDNGSYTKENLAYCIEQLRAQQLDVVCLQEVDTDNQNTSLSQAAEIAAALGYHQASHVLHANYLKPSRLQSISILSKYPILSTDFFQVQNPHIVATGPNGKKWTSFDKGFLACEIKVGDQSLRIISGHMLPFQKFKRDAADPEFRQIWQQAEHFLLKSSTPTIIGADMNYVDLRKLMPNLFQRFQEAVEQPTTPDYGQVDHILVSNQIKVEHSKVMPTRTDHYLCMSIIS